MNGIVWVSVNICFLLKFPSALWEIQVQVFHALLFPIELKCLADLLPIICSHAVALPP